VVEHGSDARIDDARGSGISPGATAVHGHLGRIALSVEAAGGNLVADAGRERMLYGCGALRGYLSQAVEVLWETAVPFQASSMED